jgi:hypothetical protein
MDLDGAPTRAWTRGRVTQRNEVAELKATMDRQCELLNDLNARLDAVTGMLEQRAKGALSHEAGHEVPQLV